MNTSFALRRVFVAPIIGAGMLLATVQAQELSFTLHEHLVIGNDEEAPVEYLFSYPEMVRTDSKGNIYVKDLRRADVRVFDAGGRYVTTIGKRGEGPSEMLEISGMHVDGDDRLIVADRMNRRFTIFTDLGKGFETKSLAEESLIVPNPILSLNDSFVLKYVRLSANPPGGPRIKDAKVLHLYDTELNRLDTFAQLGDIFDLGQPFLKAYSDSPRALEVATNGMDTIILAPTVYGGYVYRYKRSNGSWIMEKLKGGAVPQRTYIPVSERDIETNQDIKRGSIITSDATGTYRARVLSRSRGVAIMGTGEILHFPLQTPLKKDFEPQAELFGQNGSLIGFGPLQFNDPELNGNVRIMESISILWIDAADRLYLARRNEQGFFVLSVAELVISPL